VALLGLVAHGGGLVLEAHLEDPGPRLARRHDGWRGER
jgi:hypothetical protein